MLDTYDMLAPQYDSPQTQKDVTNWMMEAGFINVESLHAAHLVVRGYKP